MKTDNDTLKEIFANYLGQRRNAPDFELMWQKAAEGNKKKRLWTWRIAASVALILIGSTVVFLHHQESSNPITSWTEPTNSFIPPKTDVQLTALTSWISPTRFLLPENDHPKK